MSELKKIGVNSAWMFIGYAVRSITSVITSIFVARYLGPEQFGLMNYVMSVVLVFSVFCGPYIGNVLRRDFVMQSERSGILLGSGLIIKLIGAIFSYILLFSFLPLLSVEPEERILVLCYCTVYLFGVTDLLQVYLEARQESKYVGISDIFQCGVFLVLKLLCVFLKKPVLYFVLINASEYLLRALVQLVFIVKKRLIGSLHFDGVTARSVWMQSFPFLLAGGTTMLYQKTDQVMLKEMLSAEQVGIYTAGAKICLFTLIVAQILSKAVFPALARGRKISNVAFESRVKGFFSVVWWVMISIALFISLVFPKPFILLYGGEYSASVPVMILLTWKTLFMGMGIAATQWVLIQGLQKHLLSRQIGGIIMNIVLNLVFIPCWGASGAALASLISMLTSGFLMFGVVPVYRPCFKLMCAGLNPMHIIDFLKNKRFAGAEKK